MPDSLLYGLSIALQVRATLGLGPWDVFHDGVAQMTGLSFGTVVIITSVAVLLAWIPLREKPGLGTISNVFIVGLAADAGLSLIPEGGPMGVRLAMLAAGVGLNAVAGAAYLGARLGPGARDGLMTGFVRMHRHLRRQGPHDARAERARRRPRCSAARPGSARSSTRCRSARCCSGCCPRSRLARRPRLRRWRSDRKERPQQRRLVVLAPDELDRQPLLGLQHRRGQGHIARDPLGGERDHIVSPRATRPRPR